jgi:hypothetical protein
VWVLSQASHKAGQSGPVKGQKWARGRGTVLGVGINEEVARKERIQAETWLKQLLLLSPKHTGEPASSDAQHRKASGWCCILENGIILSIGLHTITDVTVPNGWYHDAHL